VIPIKAARRRHQDLFTIKEVAEACSIPQPVVAQLVPRTWTRDGWMYTADQLQTAISAPRGDRRLQPPGESGLVTSV
jgi:hypothetical protein